MRSSAATSKTSVLPSQRELPPGGRALQGHAGDQLHAHHLQPRGGDAAAPAAEAGAEDAGVPQLGRPAGLRCGRRRPARSERTAASPLGLTVGQADRRGLWGQDCCHSSSCRCISLIFLQICVWKRCHHARVGPRAAALLAPLPLSAASPTQSQGSPPRAHAAFCPPPDTHRCTHRCARVQTHTPHTCTQVHKCTHCTHIHTSTHILLHTQVCTHMHVHTGTHTYTCTSHAHTGVHMHTHSTHMHTHSFSHTGVHTCMCTQARTHRCTRTHTLIHTGQSFPAAPASARVKFKVGIVGCEVRRDRPCPGVAVPPRLHLGLSTPATTPTGLSPVVGIVLASPSA